MMSDKGALAVWRACTQYVVASTDWTRAKDVRRLACLVRFGRGCCNIQRAFNRTDGLCFAPTSAQAAAV